MNRLTLDQTATVAGCAAGLGVIAQVDFTELSKGYAGEWAKLIVGVGLCVLGVVTNKKEIR